VMKSQRKGTPFRMIDQIFIEIQNIYLKI